MKDLAYERKGIGEDWFTHRWFCDVLLSAKQHLAADELDDAEYTIAYASLFALERMNTTALAASMSLLAEILQERGLTLQDYLQKNDAA